MIFAHDKGSDRPPVRQPVLLGLFTGTAVGVGYLLAGVPNVELMTLVVALCGAVLGPRSGLVCGGVAATVYSLGSPLGLPVPLLLLAQVAGLGLGGVVGAWGGNRLRSERFKGGRVPLLWWSALTGVGSTLIYDLLTNLAIVGAFGARPGAVLVGAVPFFLLHAGSNLLIFTTLFPLLVPRLHRYASDSLVGRGSVPVVLMLLVLVSTGETRAQTDEAVPAGDHAASRAEADTLTAAADTTAAERRLRIPDDELPPDSGPARAFGWRRELWTPFARTSLEWLAWNDHRVPVIDGGLGASSVVLGEAGTNWNPLFVRDGIPVGTGHVLTDDPWLTPTEALRFGDLAEGGDGWGGTGGRIAARTADPDPEKAVSGYRGVKGPHETYFRSVHLLTPEAAWRAAFEFEESVDIESYNFTADPDGGLQAGSENEFPGHARVRQSRTRLFRRFDDANSLVLEYGTGRLTKDALPVLGAEHLELWDDNIAATMRAAPAGWRLETRLFWRNRDAEWGDRSVTGVRGEDTRLLETGREGVAVELFRPAAEGVPPTGLELRGTNWRIDDTLDASPWLEGYAARVDGSGQTARALARVGWRVGTAALGLAGGADWDSYGGVAPSGEALVALGRADPWLQVRAAFGGRAPRSDELLTPLLRDVAGRELILLPNPDLEREETVRLGVRLSGRLLGFDLALDGSARRLRNGIWWLADTGEADRGSWRNGLELESSRLTAAVGREGRFLGWVRIRLEGTWQQSEENAGRAPWLPPEQYLRSQVMWENHFFREDGILQLALISTLQGEMGDPWDVTRTARLPSRTVHDLLVGFRLVGAHLGLGLRNLTGERTLLTSNAVSTGQEIDLRLHWKWVY